MSGGGSRAYPLLLDTVVRRWPGADQAMQPGEGCADCFVGEPHVCPLLGWASLRLTQDEFGSWSAETVGSGDSDGAA